MNTKINHRDHRDTELTEKEDIFIRENSVFSNEPLRPLKVIFSCIWTNSLLNLSKICILWGLILYGFPVYGFSDTLPVVLPDTAPAVTDLEETAPKALSDTDSEETGPVVTEGTAAKDTAQAVTRVERPEKKKHLSFKGFIATPDVFIKDGQKGLGFDVVFGYYIGDIWYERKDNPNHFFEPIKYTLLCGDIKWAFLKKEDWGLALGGAGIIPFKGSSSSGTTGGGNVKDANPFGYGYLATGREFKSGNFRTGLIIGQIENYFNPLSSQVEIRANEGAFLGLEKIFFEHRLGIEFLYPLSPEKADDQKAGGLYLLINTFIERFIGFDLAFLIAPDNFSVMGYFNARLTLFPYKR